MDFITENDNEFKIPDKFVGKKIYFSVEYSEDYKADVLVMKAYCGGWNGQIKEEYPIKNYIDSNTIHVILHKTYFIAWGKYKEYLDVNVKVKTVEE